LGVKARVDGRKVASAKRRGLGLVRIRNITTMANLAKGRTIGGGDGMGEVGGVNSTKYVIIRTGMRRRENAPHKCGR
jgi:hypothetical protein